MKIQGASKQPTTFHRSTTKDWVKIYKILLHYTKEFNFIILRTLKCNHYCRCTRKANFSIPPLSKHRQFMVFDCKLGIENSKEESYRECNRANAQPTQYHCALTPSGICLWSPSIEQSLRLVKNIHQLHQVHWAVAAESFPAGLRNWQQSLLPLRIRLRRIMGPRYKDLPDEFLFLTEPIVPKLATHIRIVFQFWIFLLL